MARFYAEGDPSILGGFHYVVDREAPMCNERGYLGQRGRNVTSLDGPEAGEFYGWIGSNDSKKIARGLAKEWNVIPPWPACPLSERGPTPKHGLMYVRCDHCQPEQQD